MASMWLWRRVHDNEKAIDRIHGRLEGIESAPIVGVDPGRVKGLESNLGVRGAQLDALSGQVEAQATALDVLKARGEDLWERLQKQTLAISEGIERVTRAENRINNTVQRARKELKKLGYTDSGLEAEDRELRLLDAGRGDGSGLHEVQEELEDPDEAVSSVPGVTIGQLRRARGMT